MEKKFLRSALRKSTVAFSQIGHDRQGGAIELIGQEIVAARKVLSECRELISQRDGLLIDLQLLEHEGYRAPQRMSRGSGEQLTAGVRAVHEFAPQPAFPLLHLFTSSTALLLYFFGSAEKIGATGFEPATF